MKIALVVSFLTLFPSVAFAQGGGIGADWSQAKWIDRHGNIYSKSHVESNTEELLEVSSTSNEFVIGMGFDVHKGDVQRMMMKTAEPRSGSTPEIRAYFTGKSATDDPSDYEEYVDLISTWDTGFITVAVGWGLGVQDNDVNRLRVNYQKLTIDGLQEYKHNSNYWVQVGKSDSPEKQYYPTSETNRWVIVGFALSTSNSEPKGFFTKIVPVDLLSIEPWDLDTSHMKKQVVYTFNQVYQLDEVQDYSWKMNNKDDCDSSVVDDMKMCGEADYTTSTKVCDVDETCYDLCYTAIWTCKEGCFGYCDCGGYDQCESECRYCTSWSVSAGLKRLTGLGDLKATSIESFEVVDTTGNGKPDDIVVQDMKVGLHIDRLNARYYYKAKSSVTNGAIIEDSGTWHSIDDVSGTATMKLYPDCSEGKAYMEILELELDDHEWVDDSELGSYGLNDAVDLINQEITDEINQNLDPLVSLLNWLLEDYAAVDINCKA